MTEFKKNKILRQPKKERLDAFLIFPIWATAFGRGKLQRMLPPLGILSMAAVLQTAGYDVQVLDLHTERLAIEEFRRLLQKLRPRHIGVTVLSNHFKAAHTIALIAKEVVPDCKVTFGGTHAELYPEVMLKNPSVDYVCRGDGEILFKQIVDGEDPANILGLSYRVGNRLINNPPQSVEMNLDKLPLPAYELIDFDQYFPAVGTYKTLPAMNALMTRGCPGKCTFCNSAKTVLRGRSVEQMIQLIKNLRQDYGVKQITFYDDTFSANLKNVKKFCHLLIEQKIDINFVCYVRGDMFNEEMAQLFAQAGCHQILIGMETGSAKLMKDINKEIDKEQYRNVVALAHRFGIEVRGAFIIGHLNETLQTMEETLQFAMDIDVDFFQPSIMTPYPGTALFADAKSKDLLRHEDYERYGQGEVILKNPNLTPQQIYRFLTFSFMRFYFRPKVIFRQFKRLNNFQQFLDIFKSFYIIFIEDFRKGKESNLLEWHSIDLDRVLTVELDVKTDFNKLTYQVKQEQVITKYG